MLPPTVVTVIFSTLSLCISHNIPHIYSVDHTLTEEVKLSRNYTFLAKIYHH